MGWGGDAASPRGDSPAPRVPGPATTTRCGEGEDGPARLDETRSGGRPPGRGGARRRLHRPRSGLRAAVLVPGRLHHPGPGPRLAPDLALPDPVARGPPPPAGDALDQAPDRGRLRRTGAEDHRAAHGRGQAAQLQEARGPGLLHPPAHDLPVDLAGGLVVLRHRGGAGQAPHVRLPGAGPEELPAAAGLDPHRGGHPLPEDREVAHPPAEARDPPHPGLEGLLVHPGRAQHLEHRAAGPDHLPAGEVLRGPAVGHVRPRPPGNPGDLPPVLHAPRRREVQGGRGPVPARRGTATPTRARSRARRTASSTATRPSPCPSRFAPTPRGRRRRSRSATRRSPSSPAT